MTIKERADQLLDYMTDIRHDFHMHPELGLQEVRTTDRICAELEKIGVAYKRFEPAGAMCDIKGELPGNGKIALRADIDALPIPEETGLSYASQVPGVMHACGHDMHPAMLLGAVKILNEMKGSFGGTVRCIFQPGEEGAGGAKVIVGQGADEGFDKFVAIHMWPNHDGHGEIGGVGSSHGAGATHFVVRVRGLGCHAQSPQLGIDSIVVSAQIILALQTMVSRRVGPLENVVVAVGKIHAGLAPNYVADVTEFEGTIRYHGLEMGAKLKRIFFELVEGVAKANGAEAEIDYEDGIKPMHNDEELMEIAYQAADKVWGGHAPRLNMPERVMGGEDLTEFRGKHLQILLGGGGDCMGHQSHFVLHDEAMPYGCAINVQFALDVLERENAKE